MGGHDWISQEEFQELEEQYSPPIMKKIGELAKQVGGHGGMDFMMDWRLIDCLRNGIPLDQDVYDAAEFPAGPHVSLRRLRYPLIIAEKNLITDAGQLRLLQTRAARKSAAVPRTRGLCYHVSQQDLWRAGS